MDTPMLQVKNLCTSFNVDAGEVRAVNGISFNLDKGKVLGIVGESGSGKSVTAYSIMRILVEPGKIVGGEILFNGEDIVKYSKKQMREFRGKRVSIIFQDPMTSLNPTFTIGNQLRDEGPAEENGHGHHHDHPRSGRDRRHVRRDHRHVRRSGL